MRYYGQLDVPLNDTGQQQMRSLAQRLSGLSFDHVFASSMLRARQSAALVFPDREIPVFDALREIDFGKWEGLFYEQIIDRYNEDYQAWIEDPFAHAPTKGETMVDLRKRIVPCVARLLADHQGRIAIVSHAGTVRTIVQYLLGEASPHFWHIPIDNSHYWRFELENGQLAEYGYE